ncbi:MAG: hypothetical protein ACRD5F_04840, partial [Candidatus Acidiferrales bacterium]
DAENLFPQRLGERMRSDPTHPQPNCCETDDGIPWDLAAIYAPGARWDDALPAATYLDGPVYQIKAAMKAELTKLARPAAATVGKGSSDE